MDQRFRGRGSLFVLAALLAGLACTPKQIASDITSQIFKGGVPSFEMEADVEIAEPSGLTMIKMLEAFQHDNPKNKNYLILLSRSYTNYAFAFLEWNMMKNSGVNDALRAKNEQRAKNFYIKGKDYGLRILNRNAGFEKAVTQDLDAFKKSLKGMGRGYLPALFWTALSWGSWINLSKDSPLAIAEFPKAEAMMGRVVEIDQHYFYSTPLLFFGYAFGSRPPMFGGDPGKSKDFFESALKEQRRKFLMAHVMYAQSYAVQNQDRALFDALLNEVIAADANILPEQRLANELAKLRAEWLISNANQFF